MHRITDPTGRESHMDPNLFHLDWDRTLEVLAAVIVLSFFVERVAALVFETKWFVLNTKVPDRESAQAKAEKEAADACTKILEVTADLPDASASGAADAHDKAVKALKTTAKDVDPTSPLWPIAPAEPEHARKRAARVLQELRHRNDRRRSIGAKPIKEAGAFVLAAITTLALDFDAVSIVLLREQTTTAGALLTAAVIAGGSKAAIKLFQDVLGIRSRTMEAVRKPKPLESTP